MNFPKDFTWGAATSAYQIEGAWDEDGRAPSIWDTFTRQKGRIEDSSNGDITCDHYHRFKEDISLMREIGIKAYRFSASWSRVLPLGRGKVNAKGLDFYERLVDELLKNEITPFLTLYHWDLPQALEDEGGWTSRDTAFAFSEYADILSRRLGDRVKHWITHNEPSVAAFSGYQYGDHAPGVKDLKTALRVSHHFLLSHGLAIPILKKNSPDSEIGITLVNIPAEPASKSAEDQEAAKSFDGYYNRWFLDPLYGRGYPEDKLEEYTCRGYLPEKGKSFIRKGDLEKIATPFDFLGVNYYFRLLIKSETLSNGEKHFSNVPPKRKAEFTEMNWEVYPKGLYNALKRIAADYRPAKIYITENGASYSDAPGKDRKVHDARRISYLKNHFLEAYRALEEGVPLAGYFVWSLLDNFEWAKGFGQRFGIIWVDYKTQKRIIKDSGLWYHKVIKGIRDKG